MNRACTAIEAMIVIAIILIIAAIAIPNILEYRRTAPLAPEAIHISDEVKLVQGWRRGIVVDILPPRGDGQPPRFVVRYKDGNGDFTTNTFFANELSAP